MDRHDIAHYALAGALAAGLGYGGVQLARLPSAPLAWHPRATLTAEMFGRHDWTVYALPGSGALPEEIANVIRADGHKATVEPAMNSYSGIWLAPATPEGKRIAAALSAALGVTIAVDDYPAGETAYGTAYQIGVGTPK
jgi:hypothetical protein